MEPIIFLTFFSFIILWCLLGYWKKDFVAVFLTSFGFLLAGIFLLTGGLDIGDGEIINSTTTSLYNYAELEFPGSGNQTLLMNSTEIIISESTPKTQAVKDGPIWALGSILIILFLYLIALGLDMRLEIKKNE